MSDDKFCSCGRWLSDHSTKKTCVWLKEQEERLFPSPSCAECNKLIAKIARLNRELGKAQGELEGLRAGWSMSNHEAWEQGARAGLDAENPFHKPEKKESE